MPFIEAKAIWNATTDIKDRTEMAAAFDVEASGYSSELPQEIGAKWRGCSQHGLHVSSAAFQ